MVARPLDPAVEPGPAAARGLDPLPAGLEFGGEQIQGDQTKKIEPCRIGSRPPTTDMIRQATIAMAIRGLRMIPELKMNPSRTPTATLSQLPPYIVNNVVCRVGVARSMLRPSTTTRSDKHEALYHRTRHPGRRHAQQRGAEGCGRQVKRGLGQSSPARRSGWSSFVVEDKTFCVYLAENEAAVPNDHARLSGFPANKVTVACRNVIDPMTARG